MIIEFHAVHEPYACLVSQSRGRFYSEAEEYGRSPFARDRDRIIHSVAFRRLEYKTQVFVNDEGDHYRNRLTHSLEVAQIARSIARTLQVNEDLAEALALAHDLGHTPFGHAGEEVLNEVMQPYGGFSHNAHTFKILTALEQRYADFPGLNLTWETLEGVVKHNGPIIGDIAPVIQEYSDRKQDLCLDEYSSVEAQIAALADDIAYNNHDIDDGIRAGMFTLDELCHAIPIFAKAYEKKKELFPKADDGLLRHEVIRHVIGMMIDNVVTQTQDIIAECYITSCKDVRLLDQPVVEFSTNMEAQHYKLKKFLMEHMYRHRYVMDMTERAQNVVKKLFDCFMNDRTLLPEKWQLLLGDDDKENAITISDYIAGMTDRYAKETLQCIA